MLTFADNLRHVQRGREGAARRRARWIRIVTWVWSVFAGLASTSTIAAQCQTQQLTTTLPLSSAAFGWSVATDGQRVIVGSYYDSASGVATGAAYIYRRLPDGAMVLESRVTSADAAYGDYVGASVAIDGDFALVGATGDAHGESTGSAYVFQRVGHGWVQHAALAPPQLGLFRDFGNAVALRGDRAVVGSFKNDHKLYAGGAYAFRRQGATWVLEQDFNALGAGPGDLIGWSAALDGERALIGAFNLASLTFQAPLTPASAYLYRRTGPGWIIEQTLTSPTATAADGFGISVALDGDRALVGAFRDNSVQHESGSAYVFRRDPGTGLWSEEARLTPAAAHAHDYFGYSVALAGDLAVIGAIDADQGALDGGAAFVFRRDASGSWTEQATLVMPATAAGDKVGWAVATDGAQAFVGAVSHDLPVINNGAVGVFLMAGPDCDADGSPDACELAAGTLIDANDDGWPDDCGKAVIGDLSGDGVVDGMDLAILLTAWGPCPAGASCPADLDRSTTVGGLDLALLLGAWGMS